MNGRFAGVCVGLGAMAITLWLPPPDGLSTDGWQTLGLAILMAAFWISEALPVPATALVPLVALPILGISDPKAAATPYAHPLIFLFLGGFFIAAAVQRWNLHRRIALLIASSLGQRLDTLVAGTMLATALLSMWVSNTATAMMMMPIAYSIVVVIGDKHEIAPGDGAVTSNFATALMLSVAYGASIGGIATLIGTPPNAFMAAFLREAYGIDIGFGEWMLIGIPINLVLLPAGWIVLTKLVYPFDPHASGKSRTVLDEALSALGPVTQPEGRVFAVFLLTATLWIIRPVIQSIPGLSGTGDELIAIVGALLMFALPAGGGAQGRLLDWETAKSIPWGVLILFGGGLSLAAAIETTGLAQWLGGNLLGLETISFFVLVLGAVAAVIVFTEMASNTATVAAFLPVLGAAAVLAGYPPTHLAVPAAIAASCAFMLPVATPPNAIVFGSGHVTIPQMVRAGVWMSALSIFLVSALSAILVPILLGE